MCMAIACIIASAFVHSIHRKSTPVSENFKVYKTLTNMQLKMKMVTYILEIESD